MYYVGNSIVHISFTYKLLPDGDVVLHSQLREPDHEEDFLYEVHPRSAAYAEALTMVQDACEYLESLDCQLDGNASTHLFLNALHQTLKNRLH